MSGPTPSVTVAGVDLDALEKVARAADRGANGGGWSIDPIPNYQGDPDLVGSAIVSPAVMIAEVRGATQIDGKRWDPNANLAEHIATFDPPTVLKLIALARSQEPAVAGVDEVAGLIRSHVRLEWHGHDHATLNYRSTVDAARAILALQSTREPTIGEEDQGSSRADIAVSEDDTPAQSPAGGEG